ncbi:MAG: hypothetical protein ACLSFJ_04395 [Holdemania filiformis]
MGKFAETYNDFIQPLPGKKILVTARIKEIQTPYDQVIVISSIDGHHIKTAYAKYGISIFLIIYTVFIIANMEFSKIKLGKQPPESRQLFSISEAIGS